jgi:hypothetical protein
MTATKSVETNVVIQPPKFGVVELLIRGTAPLVIERFSKKGELMAKMAEGKSAGSKKVRDARDYEREAQDAKHVADEGWEGFHAGAIRAGMISACRLIGFKMTLAKMSVFVDADGLCSADGVPLVRIYGQAETMTAHTRNATGVVDVRARPMYRQWASNLRVRYDADQFSATDVINLISRVGMQVGVGAGRPDSKSSVGCGWGTFEIVASDEVASIKKLYAM